MYTQMTLNRSLRERAVEAFNAPLRNFCAFMSSLCSATIVMSPTFCTRVEIKDTIKMEDLFGNMAGIVIQIAFYVGVLVTIGGVFSLVLAYKDDNADGQTRAVRLIVVGLLLVGFEFVLRTAGIIK